MKKILLLPTIFFLLSICLSTNAATQSLNYQNVAIKAGYKQTNPDSLANQIGWYITVALAFVASLLLIYLLYAGFLYLTAGGNEEQVTNAKTIIKNGVIGLAIIASAYIITNTILTFVGSSQTVESDLQGTGTP